MTAIEAYALSKKAASGMVSSSKVSGVEFADSKLKVTLGDQTSYEAEIPLAHTVTGVEISADNHLIFTLADGESIDAGLLPSGGTPEWVKFNGEE